MKPRKIYIVGGGIGYANWMQGNVVDHMKDADLVVFTGGEDVSPDLYSEGAHPATSNNPERDEYEIEVWREALKMKKPMVGICRGAQFLCVMAGGKLIQHQSSDAFLHRINTFDEKSIEVTSTHHQAQYPWGLADDDYRVLGWTVGMHAFHQGEKCKEMVIGKVPNNIEVEDCHYPHIRALCIQSHPEMLYNNLNRDPNSIKTITHYRDLLTHFIEDFPSS